jgi:hypothetical protein
MKLFVQGRRLRMISLLSIVLPALIATGCVRFAEKVSEFPVGLYDVPPEKFGDVAAAGFNFVVAPANNRTLGEAQRFGLRIIGNPAVLPNDERKNRDSAFRAGDANAALWGWYLFDEPDLHFLSPEKVAALQTRLRAASRKPSLLVMSSGSAVKKYARSADYVAIDFYPVPWAPVAMVAKEMRLARIAMQGRPFWAVLQAFNWSAFPGQLRTDVPLREPTPEEFRCMAYLALVQGAQGLLFYTYETATWRLPEHPRLWAAASDLAFEVREWAALFGERVEWWPARTEYHGEPAAQFNEIMEGRIALGLFRARDDESSDRKGYYLMGVNSTGQAVDFSFELPFREVQSLETWCAKNEFTVSGRWVRKLYQPYEVCVFGPINGRLADD